MGWLVLDAVIGVVLAGPHVMTPASLEKKLRVPVAVIPVATKVDAVDV
jgi:hypothetical protein